VGGWVHMLPCRACRESFCEFFRLLRPEVLSCESTERWAYDLHNHVNLKLHQAGTPGKWPPPLFEDVVRRSRIPRDVDPVWQMLMIFAGHYDDTGVKDRTRVYRNYVASLADLYERLNEPVIAGKLETLQHTMRGRFTAEQLQAWVREVMY